MKRKFILIAKLLVYLPVCLHVIHVITHNTCNYPFAYVGDISLKPDGMKTCYNFNALLFNFNNLL